MTTQKATNIVWHHCAVTRKDREELNGHKGITLWFTGLSAAGKSTLAVATEEALFQRGLHTYILDGDNVRHGLNKNLGFSPEDRTENIRRVGEVAKLFTDAGLITMVAFISPYLVDRESARTLHNEGTFVEVYVECDLKVCEERDPKGAYKKARAGIIKDFTGISAPYEAPENPEIHLHTDKLSVDECVNEIVNYLIEHNRIPSRAYEKRQLKPVI